MGRREYLMWSINLTKSLPEFESPGLWKVPIEGKSQLPATGLLFVIADWVEMGIVRE